MFGLGWMELLLILIIVLIVFGAGKLPQIGEGVGKAVKGFKKSVFEPEPQQVTDQQITPHTQVSRRSESLPRKPAIREHVRAPAGSFFGSSSPYAVCLHTLSR